MKSQVISASHHGAGEVIQNHRQDESRDDGAPKRIQWIFHGYLRNVGDSLAGGFYHPGMPDHPYSHLTPDAVLNALESLGLACDGRLHALNSYENRVYQVGVEEADGAQAYVVAKFYRPARWSDAQIGEEHAFARELADAEIPVVAPLELGGRTL